MSRSFVHTPIHGVAGSRSEKSYKRFRASTERARLRSQLARGNWDVGYELKPWNEYETGRDGKTYDKDWFDGETWPERRWTMAWGAMIPVYDRAKAKKRRSK